MQAGVALFEWLHMLEKSEIVVLAEEEPYLKHVYKKPDEIIKLDFSYMPIGLKFYSFSFSKDEYWKLTSEDMLAFLQCAHAGYYHLQKQDYNIGENREFINWLYESIIKSLENPETGIIV